MDAARERALTGITSRISWGHFLLPKQRSHTLFSKGEENLVKVCYHELIALIGHDEF
jgi:hypothetical protein